MIAAQIMKAMVITVVTIILRTHCEGISNSRFAVLCWSGIPPQTDNEFQTKTQA